MLKGMRAILLISHGSRSAKTKEEVTALVKDLKFKSQMPIAEVAFLEIESPSINEGIDLCVHQGAKEIVVLLNFLNSGRHVNNDIPAIINESRQKHPQIHILISSPVGQHPKIADLFLDLINHA